MEFVKQVCFGSSWVLNSPFPDQLLALGQVGAADIYPDSGMYIVTMHYYYHR